MTQPDSRDPLPPLDQPESRPMKAFQAQLTNGYVKIVVAADMQMACEILSNSSLEPISMVRITGDVL